MTRKPTKGGVPQEPRGPSGRIAGIEQTPRGIEVRLRLRNDDARPIHYISDIRTLRYDPATRRLVVGLSDAGRVVIPGGAEVHPVFNYIDPGSEAEIRLLLPPQIVKLAPGPPDDVRFEEQHPAEAEEIIIEVAWSDVPFYEDARPRRQDVPPAESWAKGKVAIRARMPNDGGPREPGGPQGPDEPGPAAPRTGGPAGSRRRTTRRRSG